MVKIAIATALMGLFVPVLVQQDGDVFTLAVDVDLIVFNVTVTDGNGRLVPGLEEEDFQVMEDGVAQEISLFRSESAPATIGLLLDASGSMRERRAEVGEAALAFAEASNPDDEIFVVSFNENVFVRRPDPGARDPIRAAVLEGPPAGLTALYDALVNGLENLRGSRDRKALVVLSDGGDNASRTSLDDALLALQRSSATVYTIDIYDPYNRDRDPGVLRRIAEISGGQSYVIDSVDDLAEIWRDVANGIRAQYTLGYYPTNSQHDGSFRTVQISASQGERELHVRTREGYLATADED